ncbi:transcription initiation factor TFIID component TAF4 family-domain-containing protein [Fomes fomentarius]|nr:transcription initiation factor TFIID component TAF4 family-domain-containing protein [Fomes fomentarius]
MKAEDSQPQPPPTTTTFSAAQWPQTSQIPIDPALQQQSQHPQHATTHTTHTTTTPYSHYQYGHYAQTGYTHYPQYAQQAHQQTASQATQSQTQYQTPQTQQSQQTAAASVIRPIAQPAQTQSTVDTTDVATLNDALGSAGVDLKAEEETLQRTSDQYYSYRPYEDRSRKQPDKPQFDTLHIGNTMRTIGARYKINNIPKESTDYLALAVRFRLQSLLTSMIAAAKHRTDSQFDHPPSTYEDGTPMWSIKVRSDVSKQLEALQKAYREEDVRERRERKERQDTQAAQAAALTAAANGAAADGAGTEEEGGPKKKKKKEGPGVTARNMSEDVRKKMSNAVASQAAGLGTGKYAWMSAATASTPAKPKPAARAGTPATTTTPATGATSTWAKPYQGTKTTSQQQQKDVDGRTAITLHDAIFVVNNERGHGGGRGAAKAWT